MKPLISYYGGKSYIASKIIELLPRHLTYCEPFCGGASVFWKKPYGSHTIGQYVDVLNDTNKFLINWFKVMQDVEKREKLFYRLEWTPYARAEHRVANEIYKDVRDNGNYDNYDDVDLAWAFYVAIDMSFSSSLGGGFSITRRNRVYKKKPQVWQMKVNKKRLTMYSDRLKEVYIEDLDALECIRRWDSTTICFYIDPPYVNCCQAHYKGYGVDDYQKLIDVIERSKGSFVVSGYDNDYVPKEWKRYEFDTLCHAMIVNRRGEKEKRKEILWIVDRSEGMLDDEKQLASKYFGHQIQVKLF